MRVGLPPVGAVGVTCVGAGVAGSKPVGRTVIAGGVYRIGAGESVGGKTGVWIPLLKCTAVNQAQNT